MSAIIQGKGDVFGPAEAVAGNIPIFDGATGKIIKDGGLPLNRVSYAGVVGRPSMVLLSNPNVVSSGATTVTVWDYTIPVGLLGKDGDSLRITYYWATNTVAVAKTVTLKFGGVTGMTLSNSGGTALQYYGTISIFRVSANSQKWIGGRTVDLNGGTAERFDGTLDLSVNQILSFQVSSTGGGNSNHHGSMIEYLPVP